MRPASSRMIGSPTIPRTAAGSRGLTIYWEEDESARGFGASKRSLAKAIPECRPLFHSLALPRAVEPGTYRPRWAFTDLVG